MPKRSVLNGMVWKFLQTLSNQGVTFVLSIILARLLLPSEYGLVAMVNIFIVFSNVFITDGFSASLIQKKDADKLDFNSLFWVSLIVSAVLYVILYVCAPWISTFFNEPPLCKILRVYSLILFFNSYNAIQYSCLSKDLDFRKQFYSTAIGGIGSGVLGIVLAYNGWGVWALVAQALINVLLNNIVLTIILDWRPAFEFSLERTKRLLGFGIKVLSSNMLRTISNEIRQFLIAKYYTSADLAIYNRGRSFPGFFYSNLTNTISSVLFPAISNYSDDIAKVRTMMRTALQVNSVCLFFLLGLLAVIAKPLVWILLTEKWMGAVFFLQMGCFAEVFSIISSINIQAIKAMGKGDVLMKIEIIKLPVFLLLLIVGICISLKAVAVSAVVYAIYNAYVNVNPTKNLLGYSVGTQLMDILPALIISIISGVISLLASGAVSNEYVMICLQIITFGGCYILLSWMFKLQGVVYIKSIIQNKMIKTK